MVSPPGPFVAAALLAVVASPLVRQGEGLSRDGLPCRFVPWIARRAKFTRECKSEWRLFPESSIQIAARRMPVCRR